MPIGRFRHPLLDAYWTQDLFLSRAENGTQLVERLAHVSPNVSYTDPREKLMIAPESIAEILGLGTSVRTVEELETAVSAGLPKRSLERLSARLCADRRTASAYKFTVVPQATWKRRTKRLSLDES